MLANNIIINITMIEKFYAISYSNIIFIGFLTYE